MAGSHSFEAVDNFRDFGGLAGRYGRIRPGALFRSAHLAKASPADLTALEGLGIEVVADLRRRPRPTRPAAGPAATAGNRRSGSTAAPTMSG